MGKEVINFKVDAQVKREVKNIARELGLPLSAIINAQLRELIRTRTLSISAQPRMTDYLEKLLDQVERDRQSGRNVTATQGIDSALAHLDNLS